MWNAKLSEEEAARDQAELLREARERQSRQRFQHPQPPPPPGWAGWSASSSSGVSHPPQPPPLTWQLPPPLDRAEVATVIEHVLSHRHAHPLRCLGLAASTSPRGDADAIRKQYKMLALRLHPDKCEHERAREAFEAMKLAFQKLAPPPTAPAPQA